MSAPVDDFDLDIRLGTLETMGSDGAAQARATQAQSVCQTYCRSYCQTICGSECVCTTQ
jgi:hypothetical protein